MTDEIRLQPIGVTKFRLIAVDGLAVTVRGLDVIDGAPVLDIGILVSVS